MSLKLAPDVAHDQALTDTLIERAVQAQGDRATLVGVVVDAMAAEREACAQVLENMDRTGREWVPGSLWANIFRDGIAAIRARGH